MRYTDLINQDNFADKRSFLQSGFSTSLEKTPVKKYNRMTSAFVSLFFSKYINNINVREGNKKCTLSLGNIVGETRI